MAKFGNRVKETTDTTGTGTLDLSGAPTAFRAFLTEYTTGDRVPYVIVDDPDTPTDYEVGLGTITSGTPNTLSRDIVEASSNSDNKVSWTAGTKTVIATETAANLQTVVKAKTANYTVLLNDHLDLITGDSSAISPATLTITLPTVASAGAGFRLTVKNIGASGTVVVDGNGSETIDGATTQTLTNQYDLLVIVCTGSVWLVVGSNTAVARAEQATTSGNNKDFTGIPSWAKRITVQLVGVSVDDTSIIQVRLGDAEGFEATNYSGISITTGSGTISTGNISTGFDISDTNATAAAAYHGAIVLTLEDSANNTWVCNGLVGRSDATSAGMVAGSKSLSAVLTQVQLISAGTFDAGAVNILYE